MVRARSRVLRCARRAVGVLVPALGRHQAAQGSPVSRPEHRRRSGDERQLHRVLLVPEGPRRRALRVGVPADAVAARRGPHERRARPRVDVAVRVPRRGQPPRLAGPARDRARSPVRRASSSRGSTAHRTRATTTSTVGRATTWLPTLVRDGTPIAQALVFAPRDFPNVPDSSVGGGEKLCCAFFLQCDPRDAWAEHFADLSEGVAAIRRRHGRPRRAVHPGDPGHRDLHRTSSGRPRGALESATGTIDIVGARDQ